MKDAILKWIKENKTATALIVAVLVGVAIGIAFAS